MKRKANTMEKIRLAFTVFAVIVTLGCGHHLEHHYTREQCEVLEVNEELVTVRDRAGYEWDFYSEKNDLRVGEVVDLKMYTNLTHEDVFDDEVVNWKRSKKGA